MASVKKSTFPHQAAQFTESLMSAVQTVREDIVQYVR